MFGDPCTQTLLFYLSEHIARYKSKHHRRTCKYKCKFTYNRLLERVGQVDEVLIKKIDNIFPIDGLADTNSMYRRMTNFDKIMDNANAFISAGGNAHWKMIEFEHNKHQIEEARTVGKENGFANFTITSQQWWKRIGPKTK